jgi:hypothetical protein
MLALVASIALADPRDVLSGTLISSFGDYQDQPQIVVTRNGTWSAVITVNSVHEGQGSQRVMSTYSHDAGATWSGLIDVEPYVAPPGLVPRSSGWINNLLVPATDRIYAFYTWNAENVTSDPTGHVTNFNLLGAWVCRYSDDGGASWSAQRFNLSGVYEKRDIDYSNSWGGRVLQGWSVGKPFVADDGRTVLMQFSKVSTAAGRSEGFFLRATNALDPATPPAALDFELVPRGKYGLRAPTGTTAEEGNVVQLRRAGSFYAVYRTACGFVGVATSPDGVAWTDAQYARFDGADYGGGMYEARVKQPIGPLTPRRFSNGRFLMSVFGNSEVPGFSSRDPYWLVAGWEANGTIRWSQPELMLCTRVEPRLATRRVARELMPSRSVQVRAAAVRGRALWHRLPRLRRGGHGIASRYALR